METSMRITVSVLVLAAAAMLTGCEDNGVVASPEAEMIITASPEEVIIDEEAGESSGESTITVQVLEGNFVANGVNVFFEASGGILHPADDRSRSYQRQRFGHGAAHAEHERSGRCHSDREFGYQQRIGRSQQDRELRRTPDRSARDHPADRGGHQ
jgi:hypothetical protein